MDTPALARRLHRRAGRVNVLCHAPRQAGDGRALHLARDGLYRREVALADDGKAGLDHINLQTSQLPRHRELFTEVHRCARALLAVAQRGVKNHNAVLAHLLFFPGPPIGVNKKTHRGDADGGVSKFIGVLPKPDRHAAQQQRQQAKSQFQSRHAGMVTGNWLGVNAQASAGCQPSPAILLPPLRPAPLSSQPTHDK